MKLSSFLLASIASVEGQKVKTLLNRPEEDRKVPHRHPLQRLWRLYQFSEEIIQSHFYDSDMPAGKLDRLRGRIGKWLYLAQRQSFLRSKYINIIIILIWYSILIYINIDTKRCGFYNDGLEHGGPSGGEDNQAAGISNEQTLLNNGDANTDVVPEELEIYNPRPNRRRRSDDDDDFNFLDNERYNREDPCKGMKQIMTGFRKWADRYIGGCGGQANYKHQVNRANKFYGIFRDGLNCPADNLGSKF